MEYLESLKSFRRRVREDSTGEQLPERRESFVQPRPQKPEKLPTSEPADIMATSAAWIGKIRKASAEAQSHIPEIPDAPPVPTFNKRGSGEEIGKDKAPKRRPDDVTDLVPRRRRAPPSRPDMRDGIVTSADVAKRINIGYGDITQGSIEDMIRAESELRGIDPKYAIKIFRAEGASAYQSMVAREGGGSVNGREASWGPYQLFTGGGLGNDYEKLTGRTLSTDNTVEGVRTQIRFALDKAVEQGWTPWYGRIPAKVEPWDGLEGAKTVGNWK